MKMPQILVFTAIVLVMAAGKPLHVHTSVEEKCPSRCHCTEVNAKLTADCQSSAKTSFPLVFPERTKVINLQNNNLLYVINTSLNHVYPFVTGLNLTGNALQTIEPGFFKWLPSLQWLDLSSNEITDLKLGMFQNLAQLKYLDIRDNNVPCEILKGELPGTLVLCDEVTTMKTLTSEEKKKGTHTDSESTTLEKIEIVMYTQAATINTRKDLPRTEVPTITTISTDKTTSGMISTTVNYNIEHDSTIITDVISGNTTFSQDTNINGETSTEVMSKESFLCIVSVLVVIIFLLLFNIFIMFKYCRDRDRNTSPANMIEKIRNTTTAYLQNTINRSRTEKSRSVSRSTSNGAAEEVEAAIPLNINPESA